jgi:3-isopropylmalate dehydrogenase
VFDEVAAQYPDVAADHLYVDAAAMELVRRPQRFDVLVTENLLGDILSDLGAGLIGGLGVAPSADLGDRHAVFQPCHGTAPDLIGKGVANPLAAILSAVMMLDHLADTHDDPTPGAAARRIENAVAVALASGDARTADLGGKATTRGATAAILREIGRFDSP